MFVISSLGYLTLFLLTMFVICRAFHLPLFNPFSITLASLLPVEVVKVLVAPYFNGISSDYFYLKAVVLNLGFLFASVLGFLWWIFFFSKTKFPILSDTNCGRYRVESMTLRRLSYAFAGLFLVTAGLTMSLGGGGWKWIYATREAYQFHRLGVGGFYALSISSLSLTYLLFALSLAGKGSLKLLCCIALFVAFSFFFGSKGIMLNFAVFGLIILWYARSRVLPVMLVMVPGLVFPLMLFNLYQAYGGISLDHIFNYFDYYTNSMRFYEAFDSGDLSFYWGKVFLGDFWSLVPRIIYPEKPFVYGFLMINEFFYPGAAENTHTPAFGGPTQYYADFGAFGVMLAGLVQGKVLSIAFLAWFLFGRYRFDALPMDGYFDLRAVVVFAFLFAPDFLLFFHPVFGLFTFVLVVSSIYLWRRSCSSRHASIGPNGRKMI